MTFSDPRWRVAMALTIGLWIFTVLSAAKGHASITDTPARICAELRDGRPLIDLFREMVGQGEYTGETAKHDAGVAVGAAVVDRCPDQKAETLRQAVILRDMGI